MTARPMTRRARLEAAVEFAIATLDAWDSDADAETDSDGEEDAAEHSLGPVSLDRILVEELRS